MALDSDRASIITISDIFSAPLAGVVAGVAANIAAPPIFRTVRRFVVSFMILPPTGGTVVARPKGRQGWRQVCFLARYSSFLRAFSARTERGALAGPTMLASRPE